MANIRTAYSIQKFIGVRAEEFVQLKDFLKSDAGGIGAIQSASVNPAYVIYAKLQSAVWDIEYGTFTVEVIIYDYGKIFKVSAPRKTDGIWAYSRSHPTPRKVVLGILDVLGRYKHK